MVTTGCTKLAIEGGFVQYPILSQIIEMEGSDGVREES